MNYLNRIFKPVLFYGFLIISTLACSQDWQSCTYNATKDYGIYRIKNNTWRDQNDDACMWTNSKDSWGVELNYPDGVYPWGYWEIFRGAHYGDVSPDTELPIKIADINELSVDWTQKQIPVTGNRVWSLVDLYAWKNADKSDHPKGHWNILVFTNIVDHTNSWGHAAQVQTNGNFKGKFNIGGMNFYVTHSPTPEFDHAGPTTSFYMADDYSHGVSVDLESIIDFATAQGWGNDQWYFGSLQVGWEVVQGVKEGLETTAFSTTLNGSVDGNGEVRAN